MSNDNRPGAVDAPRSAPLLRDQERALHAYAAVVSVGEKDREEYKIAVHALSAEILQSSLAAAMSGLERRERIGEILLGHLAGAQLPGIVQTTTGRALPDQIRALDTDRYILATQETLQIALWLKRAVQAKFEKSSANA